MKFEKIIGNQDTTLPFSYILKAIPISKNIGRVIIKEDAHGTGFIVRKNLMITCHHVLSSYEEADKSYFQTNFQENLDGTFNEGTRLELDPKNVFFSSKKFNLTIVAIKENTISENTFTPINLTTSPLLFGNNVNIMHHPLGEPLKLSRGKIIDSSDFQLYYDAPTKPGSSGAPVFNDLWELIGIHERGGKLKSLADSNKEIFANGAVSSKTLSVWLKDQSSEIAKLILDDAINLTPTISHIDSYKEVSPQEIEKDSDTRDSVFISYAHKDQEYSKWHDRIELYLKGIPEIGERRVWQDGRIEAGSEWNHEIELALAKTKVAILLIGPYFLNSSFINNEELPKLLEAAKHEGVKIFPIITHHVPYSLSKLSKFQAFNSPEKPLQYQKETGDADKILVDLVNKIVGIFRKQIAL